MASVLDFILSYSCTETDFDTLLGVKVMKVKRAFKLKTINKIIVARDVSPAWCSPPKTWNWQQLGSFNIENHWRVNSGYEESAYDIDGR